LQTGPYRPRTSADDGYERYIPLPVERFSIGSNATMGATLASPTLLGYRGLLDKKDDPFG
jgi:hypothetical protein